MRTKSDAISQAKAAFTRISKQGSKLVEDWIIVAKGLKTGRDLHKSDNRFGAWLRENLPDLAGQPYASTRKAALWLLTEDGECALQRLKSETALNHPVAIVKVWGKLQAEEAAEAAAKVGKTNPAPAAPAQPQQDTGPAASQDAEMAAAVSVEAEAAEAVTEASAVTEAPPAQGFLARRYGEGGQINQDLVLAAFAMLDEGPEAAADKLCALPRGDLEQMQRAVALALKRVSAGALSKGAMLKAA